LPQWSREILRIVPLIWAVRPNLLALSQTPTLLLVACGCRYCMGSVGDCYSLAHCPRPASPILWPRRANLLRCAHYLALRGGRGLYALLNSTLHPKTDHSDSHLLACRCFYGRHRLPQSSASAPAPELLNPADYLLQHTVATCERLRGHGKLKQNVHRLRHFLPGALAATAVDASYVAFGNDTHDSMLRLVHPSVLPHAMPTPTHGLHAGCFYSLPNSHERTRQQGCLVLAPAQSLCMGCQCMGCLCMLHEFAI